MQAKSLISEVTRCCDITLFVSQNMQSNLLAMYRVLRDHVNSLWLPFIILQVSSSSDNLRKLEELSASLLLCAAPAIMLISLS